MDDRIEFAIIRFEGKNHLCYRNDDSYIDVSMPILNFTEGEDNFEISSPDWLCRDQIYEYDGRKVRVTPAFYDNGWPAICIVNPDDEGDYELLTVNLVTMDAIGLPNRTFVDCNNQPEALDFLVKNGFAVDTGYKRRSGFIDYPMVNIDLVRLYQHRPDAFQQANIL